MGNRLKTAFRINAEPATKEAWKAVAQHSPEVKSVMNSMNRRELLGVLLKTAGTVEGTKKLVTGHF
jgi:hypothetical protein